MKIALQWKKSETLVIRKIFHDINKSYRIKRVLEVAWGPSLIKSQAEVGVVVQLASSNDISNINFIFIYHQISPYVGPTSPF